MGEDRGLLPGCLLPFGGGSVAGETIGSAKKHADFNVASLGTSLSFSVF